MVGALEGQIGHSLEAEQAVFGTRSTVGTVDGQEVLKLDRPGQL